MTNVAGLCLIKPLPDGTVTKLPFGPDLEDWEAGSMFCPARRLCLRKAKTFFFFLIKDLLLTTAVFNQIVLGGEWR